MITGRVVVADQPNYTQQVGTFWGEHPGASEVYGQNLCVCDFANLIAKLD